MSHCRVVKSLYEEFLRTFDQNADACRAGSSMVVGLWYS